MSAGINICYSLYFNIIKKFLILLIKQLIMYYKIHDFLQDWKREKDSTQKIFNALTDDSLKQKTYDEGRTLGFLAWHIVTSVGEMGSKIGIKTDCPEEDSAEPQNASEICAAYKKASESLLDFVEKNWRDEILDKEVNLYGNFWKNGFTLTVLVNHQIHHRAQITVLMRQAGLKVPGVLGPAKEEWGAMGMQAPK